ncbi:MAG: hypothetical protein JSR36_04885 [Proteobacteria bacterium]|nr:hypothetical protein [Pseudomonadota bacterium]
MRLRFVAMACAALLAGLAAGCGGTEPGTLVPAQTSVGGIWQGSDTGSGLQVTGIVDEKGNFHFIRSDLAQFVGVLGSTNDTVAGAFDGFAQYGTAFTDGSTHGTGSLSGVLAQRSTLTLNYSFTTDLGTASSGTLNLSFNALYNQPSSLATISGNYTEPTSGDTVSISGSGAITSQDATSGCVLNGQVSLIDTNYNAYTVAYSYASCTGAAAALNGVQFSGLATYNSGAVPTQFVVAVTGTSGTHTLALVLSLNRQ